MAATTGIPVESPEALAVPAYILDDEDPAALFSRLQRVVIHLELLQSEAVRDFSISFRDFVILATLLKEPPPHELLVSQIAKYVLQPMGSISQGLARVEQRGFITRTPARQDRRKVIVRLTSAGRTFAADALASYDATRQRVFDRLGDDQLDRVDVAVTELLEALDADYLESGQGEITPTGPGPGGWRQGRQ